MSQPATTYEPTTELGKCLLAIIYEIGTIAPRTFEKVDIIQAVKEADGSSDLARLLFMMLNAQKGEQTTQPSPAVTQTAK